MRQATTLASCSNQEALFVTKQCRCEPNRSRMTHNSLKSLALAVLRSSNHLMYPLLFTIMAHKVKSCSRATVFVHITGSCGPSVRLQSACVWLAWYQLAVPSRDLSPRLSSSIKTVRFGQIVLNHYLVAKSAKPIIHFGNCISFISAFTFGANLHTRIR